MSSIPQVFSLALVPWILIPVYNHGGTLRPVVCRVLKQDFSQFPSPPAVLIVDDGSTDGGPDTLADLPVQVLRLPRNTGKGAALRAGAAEIARAGGTHMICLDADGQHYPEDLPAMLAALVAHPHAFIVGARDFDTPNVPASSRFGRSFSGFWMRVQTGVKVSDMQSGFRVYPLAALRRLRLTENGYAFEIEVLVRAAWAGFAVLGVPIRVHYDAPGQRISHFHALRDNARISMLNTRLTLRALTPIPFRRHALEAEGRISLRRPLLSLRRLLSAPESRATPGELARSAAIAIGISTLPILGLQSIALLLSVGWFRLNRLCALAMIPLTWPPLVPGVAVLLGYRLRHGEWLTEFSVQTLGYEAGQRVLEWVLGALVLAPCLALAAGLVVGAAALVVAHSMPPEKIPASMPQSTAALQQTQEKAA